jgi:hypothetical protein
LHDRPSDPRILLHAGSQFHDGGYGEQLNVHHRRRAAGFSRRIERHFLCWSSVPNMYRRISHGLKLQAKPSLDLFFR